MYQYVSEYDGQVSSVLYPILKVHNVNKEVFTLKDFVGGWTRQLFLTMYRHKIRVLIRVVGLSYRIKGSASVYAAMKQDGRNMYPTV